MTAHAAAVEDVKDLADAGKDYGAASDVYENGKNSPGKTLKKMSTKFANSETMQKEPLAVVLNAFWERQAGSDMAPTSRSPGRPRMYGRSTLRTMLGLRVLWCARLCPCAVSRGVPPPACGGARVCVGWWCGLWYWLRKAVS